MFVDKMPKPVNPPPTGELLLTTHCLFCNCSIWPKLPDLISFRQVAGVLCCHNAQQCGLTLDFKVCCQTDAHNFCLDKTLLKSLTDWLLCASSSSGICCCCCEGGAESACGFPKTCCKCALQELCIDCRAALPPDDDVPLACAIVGFYLMGQKGSGIWGALHWLL